MLIPTTVLTNPASSVVQLYDSGYIGSAQASFDVASGLTGYTELRCLLYCRGTAATNVVSVNGRFNNDSGANYDSEWQTIVGATTTAAESIGATSVHVGDVTAATSPANAFGVVDARIPFYSGTANHKSFVQQSVWTFGTGASGQAAQYGGGHWRSSSAITQITFIPASGNFDTGTRVLIYGLT